MMNRLVLLISFFLVVAGHAALAQAPRPDSLRPPLFDIQRQNDSLYADRLAAERERVMKELKATSHGAGNAVIPGITWQERGPSNSGGNVLALLFDPNDPINKKVWAASPKGGLWYTNDITDASATWTPVSDGWENAIVTALAADPSNSQVMYAGTGNKLDYTRGGGIWKTTDGGTTWTRLTGSIPTGSYPSAGQSLAYIQRIIVNASGHLFVAGYYGVVRSTDGGNTWQTVLAPNQGIGNGGTATGNYNLDLAHDLEIGTDGTLYAALDRGRVFKSANGTNWAEISPVAATASTTTDRTELALAPSTSGAGQVLYVVSRAYNSANPARDVQWFKKSTDAGSTWVDITIPTHTCCGHFTSNNGYRYLTLGVHPTDPTMLFAGSYGLFRSTDGGSSWTAGPLGNSYDYQQGVWFQPGSTAATMATNRAAYWSADLGNNAVASPTIASRSNGHRVGNVTSAAMKPAAGGAYILATTEGLGPAVVRDAGLSASTPYFAAGSVDANARTFIDTNEPNLQLFSNYTSWYRCDGVTAQQLFNTNGGPGTNPVAYDSQTNTLYVVEGLTINSVYTYTVRRATGIGGTVASTNFALPGYPYSMRLGTSPNTLFVGFFGNTGLVRYTNTNLATPTATTISSGLPQNSPISSIDVGATDNELLVTLGNYGVSSVWYTNNGGATWLNKDPAGSGLPDVPVQAVLFNPQNRQQVILGTDLGIWTTTDISQTNPGWGSSNAGMPLLKINQLTYRASDGRLLAATAGRGIFETNAFAIPYTPSTISAVATSGTALCAGNSFSVSFASSGPAFTGTVNYEVWVSDATGSFVTGQRLGTGNSSPLTIVLPTGSNALPTGSNYRVRIVAPDLDITSTVSNSMTIGAPIAARITDRVTSPWYAPASSYVCTGDPVRLNAATTYVANGSAVAADTYQWLLSGTAIAGATSQTYLAGLVGTYQVVVQQTGCAATSSSYNLQQSSNGYYLNISSRFGDLPQCDDSPPTLVATYTGEQAAIQWMRDGIDIGGATSSSYVAPQSGNYSYRITRSGCTAFPQSLLVTLGRSLFADLAFSSSGDSVLCNGTSKGSVFMASSRIYSSQVGAGGFQIDWYRDGVATNQYQNTPYLNTGQSGRYSYEVRQGTCITRSNAVVVKEGTVVPPTISLNSVYTGKSACLLDSRYMYVNGNYNILQWQRDGVDISGATNGGYTAQLTGVYTVRVQKGSCVITSLPLSLTFSNALKPTMHTYGSPTTRCSGTSLYASDNVSLNGTQYQWFRDGNPISNTNNGQYYASSTGLYSVSVTNGSCTGLSKPVYVRTGIVRKPIVIATKVLNLCAGNATYLYPQFQDGSRQWKRNGVMVSTGSPYSFYPVQSGFYTLQETTSCGVAESDPVEVKIGEPTSASLSGAAFVSSGQVAQLPVLLSGPAPWSFTLSNGQSVQNTYLNPHMVSVTAAATSTFALTGLQNACGTGTALGQATLTVGSGQADLSVVAQVSNRVALLNDIITYSLQINNAGPQDAGGVQITNRLPTGVEFVEAITPGITAVNGVVTSSIGTVQVNVPITASYRVRITQPGTYFTTAEVAATNTPDPDSQPNSGTGDGQDDANTVDLRTTDAGGTINSANPGQVPLPRVVSGQPPVPAGKVELSLDVRSSALTPKIGEAVNLSIVVANRGALAATYVVVQVLLPVGWAVTNGAGFVVTGQSVQAYLYQLPAGVPQVLVLPLQANSAGVGIIRVQILDVAEAVANAIPGNGFQNGERDEANLQIQVR